MNPCSCCQVYLATLAIMGLVLTAVLTERQKVGEALRNSEAYYRTLFKANDAIVVVKDNVFSDLQCSDEPANRPLAP